MLFWEGIDPVADGVHAKIKKILDKPYDTKGRLERLWELVYYLLTVKDSPRTLTIARRVIRLSSEGEFPAPKWAARMVDQAVIDARMGRGPSLDVALGVRADGSGKTSALDKEDIDKRNNYLSMRIFELTLLGCTEEDAIARVAAKPMPGVKAVSGKCKLGRVCPGEDPATVIPRTESSLKVIYSKWRTQRVGKAVLSLLKQEILAQPNFQSTYRYKLDEYPLPGQNPER